MSIRDFVADADPRDHLIISLCEKLYICSRLLTAAAERLKWDSPRVQELVKRLEESMCKEMLEHANI